MTDDVRNKLLDVFTCTACGARYVEVHEPDTFTLRRLCSMCRPPETEQPVRLTITKTWAVADKRRLPKSEDDA